MTSRLYITLNARLRPLDRGDRYEDPLQEVLDAEAPGSHISGGGTLLTAEREPALCDIDIDVEGDAQKALELVIRALESAGAPKGCVARVDDGEPVAFGSTEGLALYLNGTDLPDEVYATSDINDLIAALHSSLDGAGHMQSYWQGPTETAVYLYGPSAARMTELITGVLDTYPLAQRCRVVPLPLALESRG